MIGSLCRALWGGVAFCAVLIPRSDVAHALEPCRDSPYANITSAPTFVRINLNDRTHGTTRTLLIANSEFFHFMAHRRGYESKQFGNFLRDFYVPFMEAQEGNILETDVKDFVLWRWRHKFTRREIKEQEFHKLVERVAADPPYTLAELGFENREALLDSVQSVGNYKVATNTRPAQYLDLWDPRFISLLIEQGVAVSRGDLPAITYLCDRRR